MKNVAAIQEGFSLAIASQKPKLPIKLDRVTTMTGISAAGTTLTYRYSVSDTKGLDLAKAKIALVANVCSSNSMKESIQHGAIFRYEWEDKKSKLIGAVDVGSGNCP